MNAGTTGPWKINPLARRRRALRPEMEILYAAYYGYGNGSGNELFLGCCREVEEAIRARRRRTARGSPHVSPGHHPPSRLGWTVPTRR